MTLNSYVRVLFSLQLVLNLCRVHFDFLQAGWREAEGRVVIRHDPSHFWRNFQPGRWCTNWWGWQSRWDACDMTPRVRQAGSLNPPKYCVLVTGKGGGVPKYAQCMKMIICLMQQPYSQEQHELCLQISTLTWKHWIPWLSEDEMRCNTHCSQRICHGDCTNPFFFKQSSRRVSQKLPLQSMNCVQLAG